MTVPTQTGAGIFDYHVLLALRKGWDIYKGSQVQFNKLFPGIAPAVLTQWFNNYMAARDVLFEEASRKGSPRLPGVVVWLETEGPDREPLGQQTYIRAADNKWIQQVFVRQTVAIEIRATSAEMARVYRVVIRAVMNLAMGAFTHVGYPVVDYLGHTALTFEEQMIAEGAGLSGIGLCTMRYRAMAVIDIPEIEDMPADIEWWVLQSDLDLAGTPGGVVPLAE